MFLTNDMYVPALRWRTGEYQALLRLQESVKDHVVPFITIPQIEFDFEEWRPKKTVQEHVHPFARRFTAKWGKRVAWIGVDKSIVALPMGDGRPIFSYVFDELRNFEANAIPAISLDAAAATIADVANIVEKDTMGVAISIRLEDLMIPSPRARIDAAAKVLGVDPSEVDLVMDLGSPNFEPYDVFAGALIAALPRLRDLHEFRNFVVIGTAIPNSFKDVSKGANSISRHDWLFYRALLAKLPPGMRVPNFGDHTIVHPDFAAAAMDMRKIKAAGRVVYATPISWEVRKGSAFRDNRAQMHGLCASIVSSGKFDGAKYSSGDDYIAKCAAHKEGPSTLTKWKEVAINHHITRVVDDLSTLGAAP